jgi:hypothetical protein
MKLGQCDHVNRVKRKATMQKNAGDKTQHTFVIQKKLTQNCLHIIKAIYEKNTGKSTLEAEK